MTFTDVFTTILVLLGIFLLAYSAIRRQGLLDTAIEIREIFSGGGGEVVEEIKYA